ncbi:MAG: response regulator [Lachnospiraceae bacterium]|nr:response regulator [Lachnospiraceae bacterium]
MRVILVDDEPIIMQGLSVLIDWQSEGCEIVATFPNGKAALDFLRREKADMIITDIRMPECDGLQFIETIKEEKLSDAYIVILSGFDEFGYAKQAMKYGSMDYLLKPVDREELLNVVRRVHRLWDKRNEDEKRLDELAGAAAPGAGITRLFGVYDKKNSLNASIICKDNLDALTSAIEENDSKKIECRINAFYGECREKDLSEEVINFNISYLLFQLIHLASIQDDEVDQEEIMDFIGESSFEEGVKKGSSEYMLRFCTEYADYISQLRKSAGGGILIEVEKEIRSRDSESISLREMSQKYYINNAYLGQIFKKKYGMSFKDYLTDYRIQEAAKMLIRTDKKILQIAEDVGYKDSDYFVQKFIERMGCTPSHYRREHADQ